MNSEVKTQIIIILLYSKRAVQVLIYEFAENIPLKVGVAVARKFQQDKFITLVYKFFSVENIFPVYNNIKNAICT